jgi:two-component system, OmpR family, response regulator
MAHILLVEDEPELSLVVTQALAEVGHDVDSAERGDVGFQLASEGRYDLLIVDRMLPGMDGLTLVKELRAARSQLPVLFLSNLGAIEDRVAGLNCGGDDYLPKPFAFSELIARIEALLRRAPGLEHEPVLRAGELEMNLIRREVTRAGRELDLLPREFSLLAYLMRHPDQIVTRTMLLEGVWNYRFDPKTNIVETHISRLRAKIGSDLIQTIRNSGYLLRTQPAIEAKRSQAE